MGMFDYVRCKYPLPAGAPVDGYQTKDTDAQYLELYEIREDGSLWYLHVEREFRPDPGKEGLEALCGCMKKVSEEWRQERMTGEVCFYADNAGDYQNMWEFSAYFVDGQLKHFETINNPLVATPASGGPRDG